jgi:recombinational DNA repair protein (RecF pathway)
LENDKRDFGRRVRLTTYVEKSMLEALRSIADPEEDEKWESRIVRKALAEFLEKRSVKWREPKEGERVDRITSSAKSKHEQRSRPAQER